MVALASIMEAAARVRPDMTAFRPEAQAGVKKAMAGITGQVTVTLGTDRAKADGVKLQAQLSGIFARLRNIPVDLNDKPAVAGFLKLQYQADRLARTLNRGIKTDIQAGRVMAQIAALDAAADIFAHKMSGVGSETERVSGGLLGMGASMGKLSNLAMPALIGGLVALSGQAAVVGLGLGAFGAAAIGVLAPLAKAAGKVGGLKAHLDELNPAQRQAAQSLLDLGGAYRKFTASLAPEVLTAFNDAIRIAGHLMVSLQPAAQATGRALGDVLRQIDAEFQSGTWREFFQFIETNAGPDLRQLGQLFTDLLEVLPGLLEALHPVGEAILAIGDAAAQALGPLGQFLNWMVAGAKKTFEIARAVDDSAVAFTNKFIPGAKGINNVLSSGRQNLTATGTGMKRLGAHAEMAGNMASTAAGKMRTLAGSITDVNNAEADSLRTQTTFINDLLNTQDAAKQMRDALKKSHDTIGTHTQAQRDSFRAAQNYITNLLDTASAAGEDRRKQDEARQAIERAIPRLIAVKGKTADYRQEIETLRDWLKKLALVPAIREKIFVTGRGNWSTAAALHAIAQGPFPGASGMLVPGAGNGDTVPAMLTPGEAVVPKRLVPAVAPFLAEHGVPGFAAGGLVPAYDGSAGRPFRQWIARGWNAAAEQVTSAMGDSMAAAFKRAVKRAQAIALMGGPGSGALGGDQAANRALAQRMFPWGAGEWGAFNALEMSEAGFNRFARNPSSGAYGIPQALPPTKMPFAAQAAGGSHAGPQLSWMYGYIAQRYGTPGAAWAWHQAHNWYGAGTDSAAPGWAVVGENGPELVNMAGGEQVIPHMAHGGLVEKVRHAERIMRRHPEGSRRWSNLTDKLSAVTDRLRDDRALARFVHTDAVRDRLREDERTRRHLLRELRPVRRDRRVVQSVGALLEAQERHLAAAIATAQHRHMSGAVHRLEGKLHHDKRISGWVNWWLDKRWWTPTRAQRKRDDRHADAIIRDAIRAVGLPLVSFDRGGTLPPGITMALNATGRPERVTPGDCRHVIELRAAPGDRHGQYLLTEIQKLVRTRGGGDVSVAFGQAY